MPVEKTPEYIPGKRLAPSYHGAFEYKLQRGEEATRAGLTALKSLHSAWRRKNAEEDRLRALANKRNAGKPDKYDNVVGAVDSLFNSLDVRKRIKRGGYVDFLNSVDTAELEERLGFSVSSEEWQAIRDYRVRKDRIITPSAVAGDIMGQIVKYSEGEFLFDSSKGMVVETASERFKELTGRDADRFFSKEEIKKINRGFKMKTLKSSIISSISTGRRRKRLVMGDIKQLLKTGGIDKHEAGVLAQEAARAEQARLAGVLQAWNAQSQADQRHDERQWNRVYRGLITSPAFRGDVSNRQYGQINTHNRAKAISNRLATGDISADEAVTLFASAFPRGTHRDDVLISKFQKFFDQAPQEALKDFYPKGRTSRDGFSFDARLETEFGVDVAIQLHRALLKNSRRFREGSREVRQHVFKQFIEERGEKNPVVKYATPGFTGEGSIKPFSAYSRKVFDRAGVPYAGYFDAIVKGEDDRVQKYDERLEEAAKQAGYNFLPFIPPPTPKPKREKKSWWDKLKTNIGNLFGGTRMESRDGDKTK